MKYSVKVEGEAALELPEQDYELEAKDGDEASNAVRDKLSKLLPKTGGELAVVVSCAEPWSRVVRKPDGGQITETFQPGIVSEFGFYVEPHESVRKQVAARKLDKELATLEGPEQAARRSELLGELLVNGTLTRERFVGALRNTEQSLESVVTEAVAAEKEVVK